MTPYGALGAARCEIELVNGPVRVAQASDTRAWVPGFWFSGFLVFWFGHLPAPRPLPQRGGGVCARAQARGGARGAGGWVGGCATPFTEGTNNNCESDRETNVFF